MVDVGCHGRGYVDDDEAHVLLGVSFGANVRNGRCPGGGWLSFCGPGAADGVVRGVASVHLILAGAARGTISTPVVGGAASSRPVLFSNFAGVTGAALDVVSGVAGMQNEFPIAAPALAGCIRAHPVLSRSAGAGLKLVVGVAHGAR